VAGLLPPESAPLEVVSREIGVGVGTLERWRSDALSRPARVAKSKSVTFVQARVSLLPSRHSRSPERRSQPGFRRREAKVSLSRARGISRSKCVTAPPAVCAGHSIALPHPDGCSRHRNPTIARQRIAQARPRTRAVVPPAVPAAKQRVQQLSIQPVGRSPGAMPACRVYRQAMDRAPIVVLVDHAVIAERHATRAVPQPCARLLGARLHPGTDAVLRNAEKASDSLQVHLRGADTLIRIERFGS